MAGIGSLNSYLNVSKGSGGANRLTFFIPDFDRKLSGIIFGTKSPILQFAESAKSILTSTGYNESIVMDEFSQLPVTDRSRTWHMENWLAPIRRWYNQKESTLNYQDVVTKDTDAVFEIGLLNYEYYQYLNDFRMIVQIMVKLIDPKTKKVIGRARGMENYIKVGSLIDALQNNAEKHKQITEEIGKKLVKQCLVDLELIAKK
jgi:hypothetical protein